ncbi:MAG TPA: GvpL/GvpF family gas vesicle protein [Pyrinomonadaceae bacterium]|nr:GvpL/GvpF family gas vesicle protein [Pyrinomonadaceae bacterium]
MRFYVYCLVEKLDTPVAVSGISGAGVEVINLEGMSLLVSRFEAESALVTPENVLTHDTVVRSVLNETTPLPFRFGSVVTEQQLASYMSTHRASLETKLAQLRGCLEMSVKIISSTGKPESDSKRDDSGPGTAFLQQKQREIVGSERRSEQAREVADWLKLQVETYVRQEAVSLCPTEKLIVAAAHLISRDQVAEYRGRLSEARKTRPELHFLVSEPWPPYTFSNIELEFKTRFGVS